MKFNYRGRPGDPFGLIGIQLFRCLTILVAILVSPTGHCQEAVSDRLELSRQAAVEMAVSKNIDLKSEILNSAMAKANLARSKGIYDPIFSASTGTSANSFPNDDFKTKGTNASFGLSQSVPTGGNIFASTQSGFSSVESPSADFLEREWQSSVGVTISQPLLKNFGRENMELNITLAANSYQSSLEQFRFFITDTVFSVITSYNRLYKLRQVLEAREAALSSAVKLLEEITAGKKQGASRSTEIANAEFAIAQRRKDLIDASRTVSDQEASLRFLIGVEGKTPIIPLDPPSREEPGESEEQAVKIALETRPDLKQLQLTLQASELQERIARQQTLPDLSVNVSGSLSGLASGGGDSYEQIGRSEAGAWAAGLQLNVPIGNTTAQNDYVVSKLRAAQVKSQIASFSWQVRNTVEADMRALISARVQIQLAEKSREIGRIRLEEYRKNQREGVSTVQNVIDSEDDLIFAQISQVDAAETFAFTVALLWRDMGVLLDRYDVRFDSSSVDQMAAGKLPEPTPQVEPPAGGVASAGPPEPPRQVAAVAAPMAPAEGVKAALPEPDHAPPVAEQVEKADTVPVATDAAPQVEDAKVAAQAAGQVKTGGYTLQLGEFTTKLAMAETMAKVERAGLLPVVQEGRKRKSPVTRLVVGEFTKKEAAQRKLGKLRKAKVEGYIHFNDERRYCVRAGSFASREKAVKEQMRLAGLGIDLHLQDTSVELPTFLLTAGTFPTREAALAEADKLRKQGVQAVVMDNG